MRPTKKQLWLISLVFAALVVSCGNRAPYASEAMATDPTESLPARFKAQIPVPEPDFSIAAQSPAFQKAIQDAAALLVSEAQPLVTEFEGEQVVGGVSFVVSRERVESVLKEAHADFLARGVYLFRYQQNFGINGDPDKVGLLPTTDYSAVMAMMHTNGDNYNIGTDGVIAWMKELEQEQSFLLTGIGFDYIEGVFTGPVKAPQRLADRMYQFCPDIVDQGVGSVNDLARELEKGDLYFWWD